MMAGDQAARLVAKVAVFTGIECAGPVLLLQAEQVSAAERYDTLARNPLRKCQATGGPYLVCGGGGGYFEDQRVSMLQPFQMPGRSYWSVSTTLNFASNARPRRFRNGVRL
jgi:hypothetical protein